MNDKQAIELSLKAIRRILDAGHDAITRAGGECDPVDKMFADDPTVRELQAHLETRADPVEAVRKLDQFATECLPQISKLYGVDFANLNEGLILASKVLKG